MLAEAFGKKNRDSVEICVSLSLNVISSIAIIQVNKHIYVNYGFPNMTLTCLNFVITFFGLLICNQLGIYKFVRVPIMKMLPMSMSFCGFVVLANYSLEFNSIGTYQCLKALTTPTVMIISIIFYNHSYSLRVKLSVVYKYK
jgi:solute carrier family 35 protein E3